jgi:capsular polysaccharide transport system permease protein
MRDDQPGKEQPLLGLEVAVPQRKPRPERPATEAANPAGKPGQFQRPAGRRPANLNRRVEQSLTVIARQPLPSTEHRPSPLDGLVLPTAAPRPPSYGAFIGFTLCVLLPMLIAGIYLGFFASKQYEAEFRFTVKDASPAAAPTGTGGIGALLGMVGVNTNQDNYLVTDFIGSRQAVEELQDKIKLTSLYAKPDIDWWSRFDAAKPIEDFVTYWDKMISARYDQVTGIATATVRAFSPQDALLVANTLVSLSEKLVNEISRRAQVDAVRFAQREAEKAEDRLKEVRARLTAFRSRVGVIDPTTSVVASNSTLVQTLRANLAQLETQLATLKRQNLQPTAPAMVALQNQVKSTRDQLHAVEATVGKSVDGRPLSQVMGEYEQLQLEGEFAKNMLTGALAALDQARANAASQHLYITPYVRPSLPESAVYPRPLFGVLKVGALAFVIWLIGLLVVRSIRERFA